MQCPELLTSPVIQPINPPLPSASSYRPLGSNARESGSLESAIVENRSHRPFAVVGADQAVARAAVHAWSRAERRVADSVRTGSSAVPPVPTPRARGGAIGSQSTARPRRGCALGIEARGSRRPSLRRRHTARGGETRGIRAPCNGRAFQRTCIGRHRASRPLFSRRPECGVSGIRGRAARGRAVAAVAANFACSKSAKSTFNAGRESQPDPRSGSSAAEDPERGAACRASHGTR